MKRLITLLILLVVAALPLVGHAQSPDPAAIVTSVFEASNAGDLETVASYYADDAVVDIVPFGTHTGLEEIRAWFEGNMALNSEVTWENLQVDGNKVTATVWYTDDDLRAIGVTLKGKEELTVQDGKITAETWIATDESLAELMAAMPPEALPESGGQAFPIYALALVLGGLALLVGLSLGLRHRRSLQ